MNKITGNDTFRAYRDQRGWLNIEDLHTRTVTRIKDDDWPAFVAIVESTDRHLKQEAKRQ